MAISIDEDASDGVRTTVNYTTPVNGTTDMYYYASDMDKNLHKPGDMPVEITVSNAWPHAKEFTIDKNGFSIHDFHTNHEDWDVDDSIKKHVYPEMVDFLKKTLGAERVVVFEHTIRSEKNNKQTLTEDKNTSQRSPVMLVHCDYTAESVPEKVKQLLPDEADTLLSRRHCFLNVWKPIRRIVEDRPLALCDATTTLPSDVFKLHVVYSDRQGEIYVMRYRDEHKWWYFPKMTPEHVLFLKMYDSEDDGRAPFVGHSAFVDPGMRKDAPLRESIEFRVMCFY
ncbi:hypothetical protein EJ02DRAFT_396656 [Clathrospora elynae]|uniref:Methyltransferase n=1 Tax=Clathrospora elynae TaxID=706981 RepID=A0A6A5T123_9PLEO|nr:hypothetical protein EJ02DRAFT_396656 [Clathrospora elynae]